MPRVTPRRALLPLAAAGLAGALWWRRNPSPCPYGQRIFVELPHPVITRGRLARVLEPAPGERLLEVGPGTGYYSLDVAERLAPEGVLDVLDIQREMLDHTERAAAERGIANLRATEGSALELPWPDGTFDGAFLVTVLGELPDQDAALEELRRVVRPGGRIVVGEIVFDPHVVTLRALRRRAAAAGLTVARASGNALGYFARLEPASGPPS